ncbi:hypothetical protein AC249_AIPGENE15614 [Exaiptasia diaphana]|nr:hypothetical protein AC249_AIPGENE15614 [Exaiptasia diaphana]
MVSTMDSKVQEVWSSRHDRIKELFILSIKSAQADGFSKEISHLKKKRHSTDTNVGCRWIYLRQKKSPGNGCRWIYLRQKKSPGKEDFSMCFRNFLTFRKKAEGMLKKAIRSFLVPCSAENRKEFYDRKLSVDLTAKARPSSSSFAL